MPLRELENQTADIARSRVQVKIVPPIQIRCRSRGSVSYVQSLLENGGKRAKVALARKLAAVRY
jgi:hypothetical protein